MTILLQLYGLWEAYRKYLYWGALGLFAYMPFHIFISQWLSTYTGGLEAWKIAKDVFAAGLVAVLVVTVLVKRLYTRLYLGFLGIAVVYFLLHLLLLVATDQPTDTGLLATVYNNRLIWYLLIGYSLALIAPTSGDLPYSRSNLPRQFAKTLLVVSTIVCLVGLAQWILPKDIMTNFGYSIERGVKPNFFIDDKPDLPRVFSTIRDPNSLGAFFILPSTLILLALVRYWQTSRRMLLGGMLILHVLVLLLTFSRSALIGTFLAFALALGFLLRGLLLGFVRSRSLPITVVTLSAIAFIGLGTFASRDHYVVQNLILHSDESTRADDPNELRIKLFQKSVAGVAADPEGHGPGTAGLVSTKQKRGGLLTENYYLQIAYEVGLVGLLLFGAFLAYLLRELWARRHHLLALALITSFIGLSFMNFLLHTWANEAVAASWFLLAGAVMITGIERSKAGQKK